MSKSKAEMAACRACAAHSNLNTWGAVIALLEGGLLYDGSNHRAVTAVINTAKREQQHHLKQLDRALAEVVKESKQ